MKVCSLNIDIFSLKRYKYSGYWDNGIKKYKLEGEFFTNGGSLSGCRYMCICENA